MTINQLIQQKEKDFSTNNSNVNPAHKHVWADSMYLLNVGDAVEFVDIRFETLIVEPDSGLDMYSHTGTVVAVQMVGRRHAYVIHVKEVK